jgi:DUF971 family protein
MWRQKAGEDDAWKKYTRELEEKGIKRSKKNKQ